MNTSFESDVRDALGSRAGGIAPDVGARLRGIDYRPRSRRVPAGVTAGTLAGAAATAGIVTAVTLGSSAPAFAGWSPTPSAKAAVLTASSGPEQSCLDQLDQPVAAPGAPAASTGPWTVIASDVRGPYTLLAFESGTDHATCLTGPSVTVVSRASKDNVSMEVRHSSGLVHGAESGSSVAGGGGTGDLSWYSMLHLDSSTDGPFTLVDGQVASGVSAVTFTRSDGSTVQATVDNGWFMAWWPSDVSATSAQITSTTGTSTITLNSGMPKIPPPPPGSAGGRACRVGGGLTSPPVQCTSTSGGPASKIGPEPATGNTGSST